MAKRWKPRSGEIGLYQAVSEANLLPWQREYLKCPSFAAAVVGGQGCGKSVIMCAQCMLEAMRDPGGYSLVGRLNYPALIDSTLQIFLELVPEDFGEFAPTQKEFRYVNGHTTVFRHLDITDPKVAGHIKSMNLSGAYIDEACEISEETYLLITGRIRRKTALRHQVRLVSNPAGRNWVWRWFFDPQRKPALLKNTGFNPNTFDNVHLPKDRVDDWVATYPEDWADRYIYGHFTEFSDLIYKEFSDRVHVWDSSRSWGVFDGESDPPLDWPVIIGMDIGSDTEHDPWSIALIAVAPDGLLYQFDEVYGNGLLIAEIADQVFVKLGKRGRPDIAYDYAQRQCALELGECGLDGAPAIKEVDPGIFKTAQYMHLDPRVRHPFTGAMGAPRYYVSSRCRNTIREISSYSWAKDRAGNPTGKPAHDNSHSPDAIRYAIHTFRPLPEKPKVKELWELDGQSQLTRDFWRSEAVKEKAEVLEKTTVTWRSGLFTKPKGLLLNRGRSWPRLGSPR